MLVVLLCPAILAVDDWWTTEGCVIGTHSCGCGILLKRLIRRTCHSGAWRARSALGCWASVGARPAIVPNATPRHPTQGSSDGFTRGKAYAGRRGLQP